MKCYLDDLKDKAKPGELKCKSFAAKSIILCLKNLLPFFVVVVVVVAVFVVLQKEYFVILFRK